MSRDHRLTNRIFIHLLALSLVLLSGDPFAWAGGSEKVDSLPEVVARVNGQPITADRLAPLVDARLKKYGRFGSQQAAAEKPLAIRLRALDQLIEGELIYQEAQKHPVENAETRIAEEYASMRERPLGKQGRSEQELRELARRQVYIAEFLKAKGMAAPEVPEDEIRALYEESKESYRQEEAVLVRHIFVEVPAGAFPEDGLAAREKIEQARARLLAGAPFEEVAGEFSTDASAAQGGELGLVKKGFMPPEFDAVAFDLPVGEISPVIRSAFGYHVIEVRERHEGGIPPYDKMRDFLHQYLQSIRQKELLADMVGELRAQADIEILLPGVAETDRGK